MIKSAFLCVRDVKAEHVDTMTEARAGVSPGSSKYNTIMIVCPR